MNTIASFSVLAIVACVGAQELTHVPFADPAATARIEPPANSIQGAPGADGSVWIRGGRYKLGLVPTGAIYQPLFGPSAPRDFPLLFTLRGVRCGGRELQLGEATPWQPRGEAFVRTSGPVQEHWSASQGNAQQSFVVDRPGTTAGELRLTIDVTTDLQVDGSGPGVRFVAPGGLGTVHYSDAVVVDAAGRRLDVPVDVVDSGLVVVVPAAFVATAAWPLVVDPWLTTTAVDATTSNVRDPRVACDPQSGNWLVVCEEVLSATDVDILCKRYSSGAVPALLDVVYADNSPNLTQNPDVGIVAATQTFVVAWHNTAGNGTFDLRSRSATSTTQGNIVATSAGIGNDVRNRPVVGSALAGDRCLLTLFRTNASGSDVFAIWCQPNGLTFGGVFVAPSVGSLTNPVTIGDVSTLQDANDKWVVVWRECDNAACSTMRIQMRAVAPSASGGVLSVEPAVTLATGTLDRNPRIAGHGGRLLVLWEDWRSGAITPNYDIHGRIVGRPGLFAPLGTEFDLTALENNTQAAINQNTPAVSYDGVRFLCGYTSAGRPNTAVAYVDAGTITLHESQLNFATGPLLSASGLDLAHGANSNVGVHWAAWDQVTVSTGDVSAAAIDARQPGATSSMTSTGCGAPSAPSISLSGTPALGRTFTITVATPAGIPLLLAGSPLLTPLPGCGSCIVGIDVATMTTFSGSSVSVTVPTGAALLGYQLSFQGMTVLQTGGCPASLLGIDFALSDTLTVVVR